MSSIDCLRKCIQESLVLDAASKGDSMKDEGKRQLIKQIQESGLDIVVGDHIKPNSLDDDFNELVTKFLGAYKDMISYLEHEGLIQIHGYQIQQTKNR